MYVIASFVVYQLSQLISAPVSAPRFNKAEAISPMRSCTERVRISRSAEASDLGSDLHRPNRDR
jgi:hypothetical protein